MKTKEEEKKQEIVRYCIEKSMLETLKIKNCISDKEYEDIKNDIEKSYGFQH